MNVDVNPEVRRRIISAANHLFESGDGSFPNVDAVRRLAKVNMNDASIVMKEWRRMQTTKAAEVPLIVPNEVLKASTVGLEHLWRTAQECANQSLHAAQAGWELERLENDGLCEQLSAAFDAQAAVAADVQHRLDETNAALREAEERQDAVRRALVASEAELVQTRARVAGAEARAVELEQRTLDLKQQLEQCHHEQKWFHESLEIMRVRCDQELNRIREELGEEKVASAASAVEHARCHEQLNALRRTLVSTQEHCESNDRRAEAAEVHANEALQRAAKLQDELTRAQASLLHEGELGQQLATGRSASQDALVEQIEKLLSAIRIGASDVQKKRPQQKRRVSKTELGDSNCSNEKAG